ncbi:3-phosphoshikimate 1-carboxyvinyltransferase [Gracilimonas sediminicola]|uniref:3-phosphoshikimate 1-carboxyvinyltransferase n=1 Tax=Gracilimonas sediminicola TaxID=2952158 RepID=A0A9X2L1Y1_9BACT|nr:3-phosphoshikimate 1-carboxyvinyltransferase [Gracilimonas sediminicola]MCP9290843.1 3-phosphoshikimate 1-carboxyvinyltransferase [Gracilimonas sediminicola]
MIKKITSASSLKGELTLPPDKSISQRAAIFSLLYDGVSEVKNYSQAQDPQSTLSCVQQLGAEVKEENGTLIIKGTGRKNIKTPVKDLDCGNSGTAMRLLSGVLVGANISAKLVGDESLCGRTMTRIIKPLEKMGAHILARNGAYAPLFINRNEPLKPLQFELPIPSAQLKSCVLLAGLFGEELTQVIEILPSRDHSERLLNLDQKVVQDRKIISASLADEIPNQSYTIPGDFSAAAFWLVAGAIQNDAEIKIGNVGLNPTRNALLDILDEMGADITIENERMEGAEPAGDIIVKGSDLKAIEIDPKMIPNCIDELPILSVAMLFAEGTSTISGAEELRHKETDRIMAMANMLNAVGANFEEKEDGLIIHGDPDFSFSSANFESYHDHRIAMAAAVLSLKGSQESFIKDAESAAVSYPGFWNDLEDLSTS